MSRPSMICSGVFSRSMRSLNVPGSASSQLQTRYLGRPSFGRKLHFLPVGKPAPPRPRRFEALTSLTTASGVISRSVLRSALKPPRLSYTSMSARSNSPRPLVRTGSKGVIASFRRHRGVGPFVLPLFEQPVELSRRHVVVVLQVVLETRRLVARRETLDLFVRDEAVGGRAAVGDAEARSRVPAQFVGAAEHARERAAHLNDVLADRALEEQRVERCDRLDLAARQAGQGRRVVERGGCHVTVFFLAILQERDERALRVVMGCDERPPLRFADGRHRSTSPKTGSRLPMIATTSAMRLPGARRLSACRL